MEFKADLHCHTTCSDGSLSPEALVHLAKEIGLSALSITDHDTVDAYPIALPLAKKLGIEMIPGVEFSAVQDGVTVHVLGYCFDLDSPDLKAFCQKHQRRRTDRNRAILKKLAEHGLNITEEEILAVQSAFSEKSTIGRPHIAVVMIQKGYVKSVFEAFQKFLGEGKKCYAAGDSFTVQETIDLIHAAKGLAVIAHPHLIHNPPIVHQLLKMNFDGIECYYANFDEKKNRRWLRIAEKNKWLVTGGSDFHGSIKPQIALGASYLNKDLYERIRDNGP